MAGRNWHWARFTAVGAMIAATTIIGCGGGAAPSGAADSGQPPVAASAPQAPAAVDRTAAPSVSTESIETAMRAAESYLNTRNYSSAEAILAELVRQAPSHAGAHELLAQVVAAQAAAARERGDEATATRLFRQSHETYLKVIELQPPSAGLQQSAGMIAASAGDEAVALRHFRSAGLLDPANAQHPLYEAQLLIKAGQFEEARQALARVLAIDPSEAFARASLASIALEENRCDEALLAIGEARAIDAASVELRIVESRIHRRCAAPQRAIELLAGLSETERAREAVAFELAAAYSAMGEHIKAARAWEHRFVRSPLEPRAWTAAVHAAECLLAAGEREQAWLWYRQAQLAAPSAPEVRELEARFGGSNEK
jgi:predicted Zn-dependent protease